MIHLLMKPQKKDRNFSNVHNSNYIGISVIYLVSAAIAATLILPEDEYWYLGVIKSLLWPLYRRAKLIS